MIRMRRSNYNPAVEDCDHAGLLLDKGFEIWGDDHNQKIAELHQAAAKIYCSGLYKLAYARWCDYQLASGENSQVWFGQLENRLYIGLGEISPLEAGITLHRSYGVPFIPGSAVKGVLHHYALEAKVHQRTINLLFGEEASATRKDDSGSAGFVIFNDAWWVPNDNLPALVPETITVHHPDYYSKQGKKPATDFDSPNPNPQIAVQGSFMFSVEGDSSLSQFAIALLKKALKEAGIGAKTSSGYGFFDDNESENNRYKSAASERLKAEASPEERIRLLVEEMTLKDLPAILGPHIKKTAQEITQAHWNSYIELILRKFGGEIEGWKKGDKNKKKAYNVIHGNKTINW